MLAHLGPDRVAFTTLEDESVRLLRDHYEELHPDLLVGLSLGRHMTDRNTLAHLSTRLSELLPGRRLMSCRTNLVVCPHLLARLGVARWAARRGIPLLVWTVDDAASLAYWTASGAA